jgi:hypothetical protein
LCLVFLSRAANLPDLGERERAMQTTISVAAIILGAAAIILGTVGVGTCRTTSDLVDTKLRSSDDRLAFKMPRQIPIPRGWPGAAPGARP